MRYFLKTVSNVRVHANYRAVKLEPNTFPATTRQEACQRARHRRLNVQPTGAGQSSASCGLAAAQRNEILGPRNSSENTEKSRFKSLTGNSDQSDDELTERHARFPEVPSVLGAPSTSSLTQFRFCVEPATFEILKFC
jgi:hypothetical protein